jgi:hypothetical protein
LIRNREELHGRSKQQAREYDNFLRRKVDAARAQMARGEYRSNDEVDADFAARLAALKLRHPDRSAASGAPKLRGVRRWRGKARSEGICCCVRARRLSSQALPGVRQFPPTI